MDTEKVFNDLLGFRSLCDSYSDIIELKSIPHAMDAEDVGN